MQDDEGMCVHTRSYACKYEIPTSFVFGIPYHTLVLDSPRTTFGELHIYLSFYFFFVLHGLKLLRDGRSREDEGKGSGSSK